MYIINKHLPADIWVPENIDFPSGVRISVQCCDICCQCVSFSLSHTLQQVHLLYLSSPRLELILTSAISELSCKVIMFTLGESSQRMVVDGGVL